MKSCTWIISKYSRSHRIVKHISVYESFPISSSCCLSCHLPIIRKGLEFVSTFSNLQQENKRLKKIGLVLWPFHVTRQYGSNDFWTDYSWVQINFPFGWLGKFEYTFNKNFFLVIVAKMLVCILHLKGV